jgi:drug/metabolite transporter (DMT)-like permease
MVEAGSNRSRNLAKMKKFCRVWLVAGFLLVLLSSFFFCFQNVIVRILFNPQVIFGLFETGGFVAPTLQNSFLLMFMRMLVGVPLMAALAMQLYPPMWQDLRNLLRVEQRQLLGQSLVCGLLMFLYLALLYVSIGLIPTGVALTLFFTYPVFTALLSWRWLGERLSLLRWGIMSIVLLGSFLTLPLVHTQITRADGIGIATGLASGLAYAFYTVIAQKSFERIHPVPFTWISFATTLVMSGLSLLVWHSDLANLPWLPLWIGGFLSAFVTFTGHLLNNSGIRLIGATTASLIGATNPALTVVLAWVTIQEALSGLQVFGVGLATLGIGLLSKTKNFQK